MLHEHHTHEQTKEVCVYEDSEMHIEEFSLRSDSTQ